MTLAREAALDRSPERLALPKQDYFIVREFLAELSPLEKQVFRLLAEGVAWHAAAEVLPRDRNEIRSVSRSCERKRERFALLCTTGRLCGYRAQTIAALKSGELDDAELAELAHAHLQGCSRCRAQHGVDGQRLRGVFEAAAAALLPCPATSKGLAVVFGVDARGSWLHECASVLPRTPLAGLIVHVLGFVAAATDAGVRTVPMTPLLREILIEHRATSPYNAADSVFRTRTGRPQTAENVRNRILTPARERANELLRERDQDRSVISRRTPFAERSPRWRWCPATAICAR